MPHSFSTVVHRCFALLRSGLGITASRTNKVRRTTGGIIPQPGSINVTDVQERRHGESLPPMTAFDIVVVGAGGGPDETNLSSYLFKPHNKQWEDGVLALDAGSGKGALRRILKDKPRLFQQSDGEKNPRPLSASEVYNAINGFLVTHAHMDHIMGLVLSAGSLSGPRKRIHAVKTTLEDIEASVFNDRAWPNLASWNEKDEDYKFLYSPLTPDENVYETISPDVSVQTFPVNHGKNDSGAYESVAFFVRHDLSGKEFLFFGDVEPDSLSPTPRTLAVWRAAAPKIPTTLSTIFIECSWPSGRPDAQLFGHLTPEHLVDELTVLANEVRRHNPPGHSSDRYERHTRKRQRRMAAATDIKGALTGLTVYVMHCKDGDDDDDRPMREVIVEQVQKLVEARGLGCTIRAAVQGMCIQA